MNEDYAWRVSRCPTQPAKWLMAWFLVRQTAGAHYRTERGDRCEDTGAVPEYNRWIGRQQPERENEP